jgi:hypothetical protein
MDEAIAGADAGVLRFYGSRMRPIFAQLRVPELPLSAEKYDHKRDEQSLSPIGERA